MENFKPIYTWPSEPFPFRLYFNDEKVKIFIIECIDHNFNWLEKYKDKINDHHFFFVCCGWYHDNNFALSADKIFSLLGLNKENFFFMFNSQLEKDTFSSFGFIGEVINNNCWLDENAIQYIPTEKVYDAIMVARRTIWKRHFLASKVKNLALISGGYNANNPVCDIPTAAYQSNERLPTDQVCLKINQSRCGLALSASEGACYSSSEYLLCGIPVVSTKSFGGRDIWYNEYNSIISEADEDSVSAAVQYFVENPRDPNKIRNDHIEKSKEYRATFIGVLQSVFDRYQLKENAEDYFKKHFFNKMRASSRPNFEEIFGKVNYD